MGICVIEIDHRKMDVEIITCSDSVLKSTREGVLRGETIIDGCAQ